MRPNTSKLEDLLKKVGDMCNVNYRFHRVNATRTPMAWCMHPKNSPRRWTFEWWKRVPGNPRNLPSFHTDGKPTSELSVMNLPDDIKTKDDAIEYVLFKSDFLQNAYGSSLSSYDALHLALDMMNAH